MVLVAGGVVNGMAGGVVNGMAGGGHTKAVLASAELFDLTTEHWMEVANLSSPHLPPAGGPSLLSSPGPSPGTNSPRSPGSGRPRR